MKILTGSDADGGLYLHGVSLHLILKFHWWGVAHYSCIDR